MLRRATALKRICDRQRVQNAVIRYIIIISKEVQVFRVLPQEREEDGFAVDSIRIINEPLVYHFLGNAGRQGMVLYTKVYKWRNRTPICSGGVSNGLAIFHHLLKCVIEFFIKGHAPARPSRDPALSVCPK